MRGTAAQLEAAGLFGRSTKLSETPLHAHPVYTGGPDTGEHVLTALHGDVRLAQPSSSRQPLDGVFLDDAMHLVGRDNVDMAQVRIFSGCIRWRKGELEREVDEGSWYCISASNLFALKHCIQLPKPLWVEIMQSQGQPFAQIASRVYNEDSEEDATE